MSADAIAGAPAFDLTPDQRETLDAADRYSRNELYPLAERMDREKQNMWSGSLSGSASRARPERGRDAKARKGGKA